MSANRLVRRRRSLAWVTALAVTSILLCPSVFAAGLFARAEPCHSSHHSESSNSTPHTGTCCLAEKPQVETVTVSLNALTAPIPLPADHTATIVQTAQLPAPVARSALLPDRSAPDLFVRHGALRR